MRIAFIGAGKMASAMAGGLISRGAAKAPDISCIGGDDNTAAELAKKLGVAAAPDLGSLLRGADVVILACKPQQLADLDPKLADLAAGKLIISILAGKRVGRIAQTFPRARNVIRAMPNTPGQIGAGVTAWCSLQPPSPADATAVDTILGALGRVVRQEESRIDAVTAVSGSGPAYVFEFVAALREAGVAAGLPRDIASTLAQETVLGSARLLAETGTEPESLRDQVTSPNGTTYAALQQMKADGFRDLIRKAVMAAKVRSEELSRD